MDLLDYRNGQYQGSLLHQQRHGPGIFIDDDLTLYASHWFHNQLNGPTLLYISHGKYIYGQWKCNQLDGLAVFRSGQTVLVGQFRQSKPVKKCLIIFERYSFACILQLNNHCWSIVDSSSITSHQVLLSFVQKIGVPVPDHYFSLTKYVCKFSQECGGRVKAWPCFNGCCYFGFRDGLAMIFNSNNGLISIGKHQKEDVNEFGGRFQSSRQGLEGNFQHKSQTVAYSGSRPVQKIYRIFQRLHRRGLNFVNDYFDSKIKIFSQVEVMLRSQLDSFNSECRKKCSLRVDLNDSLEYQEYTEEESFKMIENRDTIYGEQNIKEASSNKSAPKAALDSHKAVSNRADSKQNETVPPRSMVKKNDQRSKMAQIAKKNLIQNNFSPPPPQPISTLSHHGKPPFKPKKQEQPSRTLNPQASMLNSYENSQEERSKSKAKLRNHRYRVDDPIVIDDEMLKNIVNTPRTNEVYKETVRVTQEEPQSFKLPTFKAVSDDVEDPFNKVALKGQPQIKKERSPQRAAKNREIYQLGMNSYQEIEQRRKRILHEYRQAIDKPKMPEAKLQYQNLHKYESPLHSEMFSLPREEQQSLKQEVIPLSLYNKASRAPLTTVNRNEAYVESSGRQAYNFTKKNTYPQSSQIQKYLMREKAQKEVAYGRSIHGHNMVDRTFSPSKRKKSYQYTFE